MASRDETAEHDAFRSAAGINVLGNTLKIIVEGGIGLFFGSVALLADATHSLADLVASIVVFFWGRLSFIEPDSTHPHGHERIEPLTALFVGATIIVLALYLLGDSALKILEGPTVTFSPWLAAGLGFAIIDMILVYFYTVRVNRVLNSPGLRALAKDCLNDVYTSFAAAIGVVGIMLDFAILDPIAGGIVALLVLHQGTRIAWENIDYLAGGAPPQEKQQEILSAVREHEAVRGVHDFAAHYIGSKIEVEVHIEIDGDYTVREAHDIETAIYERVMEVPEVGDVHIHLDPAGIGEWKKSDDLI